MVPSVSAGGTGCATYLKKTPTKPGRVSLSAVRDYRDESGRTRQRTVRTFGFVDALEAEFEDPVAHFRRDEDVEAKVVAMWSRKYAERARHEREKVLERARQLVERPGACTRAAHYGAAQYVRDVTFDAKTGEALEEAGVRPQIDQAAIDEAARLDGYHLIVTSETDWEDFRILDAYREPWRIEESFKVTKTGGLESRPVWA
uniref:hypothetical protein n=1 Tax=Parafannyhessea umbonata TaxID=604330 RepID=UPI00117F721C|nr:hypothetical protein [Parafannyhessea umbonata]